MQCNGWSTTTRFIRTVSRFNFNLFDSRMRGLQWQLHALGAFRTSSTSEHKKIRVASATKEFTPSRPLAGVGHAKLSPPGLDLLSSLPPATIARAASQTIRLCSRNNQFVDALYILNSMRFSVDLSTSHEFHAKPTFSKPAPLSRSSKKAPIVRHQFIEFRQRLPVRLASHSFLHGLLRAGLSRKAAEQAELMMADGIRIRTKTMETILTALVSVPSKRYSKIPFGPQLLRLGKHAFVSNGTTRIAVDILEQARKHRQKRTERMYDIVIKACLLQGEIIVASLLFAILVKDWEIQEAAKARREAAASAARVAEFETSTDSSDLQQAVYPKRRFMVSILGYIEKSFSEQVGEGADSPFPLSLQALAIIAQLLDERVFYTSRISLLVRALYSVPQSNLQVWLGTPMKPKNVHARTYFHDVLERLVWFVCGKVGDTLGRHRNTYAHHKHFDFDLRTYNALLHYSLKHRLSPLMTNALLQRMSTHHALQPDITTYNILLRSGTLLRRSDLSENVIQVLTQDNTDASAANQDTPHSQATWERLRVTGKSRFIKRLWQLKNGTITVPSSSRSLQPTYLLPSYSNESTPKLPADKYTLTSFIVHLTSTDRAHLLVPLLWYLLPELGIVDYPPDLDDRLQDQNKISGLSREECIKRAVAYGPYVFTVILNALAKAGKTGLAERVWILAKEVEKASWIDGFVEGVEPWCLPVHAYTCMLQCYAAEGKKGLELKRVYDQWTMNSSEWIPKSNNHVRGWAKFVYSGMKVARSHRRRSHAARIMGTLLHRSMISGAEAVFKAMASLQRAKGDATFGRSFLIPTPDARYFNAALSLFGRKMRMYRRAVKSKKSHWRWLLGTSRRRYEKTGMRSIQWHPTIHEVVQEMENRGYPVPMGYSFMLVGRRIYKRTRKRTRTLQVRPWLYPDHETPRFRPHSIPTLKSRGLPVRIWNHGWTLQTKLP
jgi:hypothetical protein